MILTIAARELRSLFLSPLAWSIMGVVQFVLALLFLFALQDFLVTHQARLHMYAMPLGVTDFVVVPLYNSASIVLMMVVPLITMRVISEERRSRSLALLFSAPISMTEIVLGKYLGVAAFFVILTLIYSLMPISLLLAGSLDFGLFASILLGALLMVFAFAAIGVFMSSLTNQPTIAAISTFGALLLLWIINMAGSTSGGEDSHFNVLSYLSMLSHYESFARGIINSTDVVYFLLVIVTFMVLSIRRLDSDRLQR